MSKRNSSLNSFVSKKACVKQEPLELHDPSQNVVDDQDDELDIEQDLRRVVRSLVRNEDRRSIKKLSMLEFSDADLENFKNGSVEACRRYFCGRLLKEYTALVDDQHRGLFEKTWLVIFKLGLTDQGMDALRHLVFDGTLGATDLMDAFNDSKNSSYSNVSHCIPKNVYDTLRAKVDRDDDLWWLETWCRFHLCQYDDPTNFVIDGAQVRTKAETGPNGKVDPDPVYVYVGLKRSVYFEVHSTQIKSVTYMELQPEAQMLVLDRLRQAFPALEEDPLISFCSYKSYSGVTTEGKPKDVSPTSKTRAIVACSNLKLVKKVNGQWSLKLYGSFASSSPNFIVLAT